MSTAKVYDPRGNCAPSKLKYADVQRVLSHCGLKTIVLWANSLPRNWLKITSTTRSSKRVSTASRSNEIGRTPDHDGHVTFDTCAETTDLLRLTVWTVAFVNCSNALPHNEQECRLNDTLSTTV